MDHLYDGLFAAAGLLNTLFIPGWLLVAYLEKLGKTTRELYGITCLGLSMVWLMMNGVFLNLLGAALHRPLLTAEIVIPYVGLSNLVLLCAGRLLGIKPEFHYEIKRPLLYSYGLSLILLAAVGARLVTHCAENVLLLFLLPFIAVTVGILAKKKSTTAVLSFTPSL